MNASGNVQQMLRCALGKIEAKLTSKGRKHISKGNFALPGKKAYPIHDLSHARNALARASGKPEEKTVKAAVYSKWPSLKKESAAPAPIKSGSIRITESARIVEALPDGKNGEKVFKVILISEGPGNRRNKNFYGSEAVASSVKAFEGRWCYLNHQDAIESETLPERRVQDKAGYFKNLGIIKVKEGTACAGELHCDLSESGRFLAEKILSALKYKESFPDNNLEYVGFSVNADGDSEPRDMTDRGGSDEDNYVTAITEGDSCDLVTTPARGGRGLAVIKESKTGAVPLIITEGGMKKQLEAIFAKFSEAVKTLGDEDQKKFTESKKALASAIKEADDMGEAKSPEEEAEAYMAKREGESDEDHMARLHAMAKGLSKHMEANPDDSDEPDDKTDSPDQQESKRDAINGLIKESGLPADYLDKDEIKRLCKLPYLEAKASIRKDARLAESIRKTTVKGMGGAASFHRSVSESEGGDSSGAFVEAARGN